jgi:hypothetical protein
MKKQLTFMLILLSISFIPFRLDAQKMTTKFQEVKEIPEGKGVIYIYRISSMGWAVHYTVNANDSAIMKQHLYKGGYMVYFANPGKNEIWGKTADQREGIIVDVKAGGSYFVEGSVKSGTWVGRPYFQLIPREKAMKKIIKCKLLVDDPKDKGKK